MYIDTHVRKINIISVHLKVSIIFIDIFLTYTCTYTYVCIYIYGKLWYLCMYAQPGRSDFSFTRNNVSLFFLFL